MCPIPGRADRYIYKYEKAGGDRVKRDRKTAILLTVSLLTGAILPAFDVLYASATSTTQQQITDEENAKAQLEEELGATQSQLEGLKGGSG